MIRESAWHVGGRMITLAKTNEGLSWSIAKASFTRMGSNSRDH